MSTIVDRAISRTCPTCRGDGTVKGTEICTHPPEDREGINCHRCHDTGFALVVCPDCAGAGVARDPERSSPPSP